MIDERIEEKLFAMLDTETDPRFTTFTYAFKLNKRGFLCFDALYWIYVSYYEIVELTLIYVFSIIQLVRMTLVCLLEAACPLYVFRWLHLCRNVVSFILCLKH